VFCDFNSSDFGKRRFHRAGTFAGMEGEIEQLRRDRRKWPNSSPEAFRKVLLQPFPYLVPWCP
jgi:hypothetical protein